MLILTAINPVTGDIRVYDTDDGTNEVSNLVYVYNSLYKGQIKIKGLEIYDMNKVYPLDARLISKFGVVVLPAEAKRALKRH